MKVLTYRRKLSLTLLALLLLPTLMFSYLLMYNSIRNNERQLLEHHARLASSSMDYIANSFDSCMLRFDAIEKDSRMQGYLYSSNNSLVDLVEINYYVSSLYNTLTFGETGMDIIIYRSLNNTFPEGYVRSIEFLDGGLLSECLELVPGDTLIKYDSEGYFRLFRQNRRIGQDNYFIIEIRLPLEKFQSQFSPDPNLGEFSAAYWANDGSVAVLTEQNIFAQKECYVFEYTVHQVNLGYRYVLTRTTSKMPPDYSPPLQKNGVFAFYVANTQIYSGVYTIAALLIGLYASVVLLVFFISKLLTRRLYYVVDQIRHQYEANSSIAINLIGNKKDEFYIINSKLSELFEMVRSYYEDLNNMAIEKKELETQLLQELINPHFLYNTLDAIKWVSSSAKLTDVVDSLISYYRTALSKGSLYVTVENEISNLEKYIKLQQFSYESDFQYSISVEQDIRSFYTIKHILQPFVENSILHGIDKTGQAGLISINGYRQNEAVVFDIIDNGCGIENDMLRYIADEECKTGYGIMNVRKRIKNLFGEGFGVRISSEPGVGTKVRITVPVIEKIP